MGKVGQAQEEDDESLDKGPKKTAAEIKAEAEEAAFLASFESAFSWYEGERFPCAYLSPADVAVLFETMGFGKCVPKILNDPVDGPTMAILTDSDLELMGLMLPAQRRRVLQEIRLFRELGCPQASEINADALEQHQTEAATLEQHHMDAFQGLLEGEPPPMDAATMMKLQLQMASMNMTGAAGGGIPATPGLAAPTSIQANATDMLQTAPLAQTNVAFAPEPAAPPGVLTPAVLTPPAVEPAPAPAPAPAPLSPKYTPPPLTAEDLEATAEALKDLPKVFVAQGKERSVKEELSLGRSKRHKWPVRESLDLDSKEVGEVAAGDEVVVVDFGEAINTKGDEVDRYKIGAPFWNGWVTAANFRLATDPKKQKEKYMESNIFSKLSSKDKKARKKIVDEQKKKEKEEKKAKEKAEKEAKKAEAEAKKKEKADEAARKKAEKDAKKKGGSKPAVEEPSASPVEQEPRDCKGKWKAKGEAREENKVRMGPGLDTRQVGLVYGGTVVSVIGEETIKKKDGSTVRRLNISSPKAGWVSAGNFTQALEKEK